MTLSARAADGAPVEVDIDGARVEQILLILLDNALRHTPSGGTVEVVVGRDGQDATMAVHDTGEGIPAEAQPFVFDRFYRGDPSREGRSAGLGLAIARGLAAAHRGGIDLGVGAGRGQHVHGAAAAAGGRAGDRGDAGAGPVGRGAPGGGRRVAFAA